jgi:hypothetical protein
MRRITSFFGIVTISITLMLMKLVLPIADAQQDNQNMTESNTINGMMNMMQDDQERMSSTTVMDQMMNDDSDDEYDDVLDLFTNVSHFRFNLGMIDDLNRRF